MHSVADKRLLVQAVGYDRVKMPQVPGEPTQAIIPLRGRGSSRCNPPNNWKLGDSASPVHGESEGTVRRTVSKDAVSAEIVSRSGGNCRRGGFSAINRRR